MRPFQVVCLLITVWLVILIGMMLNFYIQEEEHQKEVIAKPYQARALPTPKLQDPNAPGAYPSFVPVIGGVTRKHPDREETLYPGTREYAVHIDINRTNRLPSEYGGALWPNGDILPDILVDGDPKRPRFSDAMSSVPLPYRPGKVQR